jgi:hypothetical protein
MQEQTGTLVPLSALPFESSRGAKYMIWQSMGELMVFNMSTRQKHLCDDLLGDPSPEGQDMQECVDYYHKVKGIPL